MKRRASRPNPGPDRRAPGLPLGAALADNACMPTAEPPPGPHAGLRERKKARTQAAILHHALRLFRERGYQQTTVEQIAEAAEVSKTTFFRYFPTKDDVVLHDRYDEPFFERLRAQPRRLGPLAALRETLREFRAGIDEGEVAESLQRLEVIAAVPELHARLLDQFLRSVGELQRIIAERAGRGADDPDVLAFTGAVAGAMMAFWLHGAGRPFPARLDGLDEALARLEGGLPLA